MRSRVAYATVASVLLAGGLVTFGLSSATSAPAPPLRWAMASSSLEHLLAASPGVVRRDLDAPETIIQNDPPLRRDPAPEGWRSSRTERFTSFTAFRTAVREGAIPPFVEVVHYDDEDWSQTPLREQRRPGLYMARFCALAHANGWNCYTGPGQDLCGSIAHPAHETYAQCYLVEDLAGKAARQADVIDIQAQSLEPRGARAYGIFIRRAAAQARAANPDVIVLGNIAASPEGVVVGAARLYRCAEAALPYVSGFYTTVSAADAPATAALLRRLPS